MIRTSETTAAIMPALVAAQLAIGGGVAKNKKVDAGARRYRYADLGAVIDAAGDAMGGAGLAWISSIGERGVVVRLCHSSGEWIECDTGISVESARDAQAVGSALTYGRRYGLMALLGLAAEDDDGQAATRPAPPKAPPPPKPRAVDEPAGMMPHHREVASAIEKAKAAGLSSQDVRDLLASCGFERLSEIGVSQAATVVDELCAAVERAGAA
jgi:hypothetical protein